MSKLVVSNHNINDDLQLLHVSIYKYFPLSGFLYHTVGIGTLLLFIDAIRLISGNHPEPFSVKMSFMIFIAGSLFGIMAYVPSYLSALIMNARKKPILRFDAEGFYYTPQIWSKNKLYRWETITNLKIGRGGEDEVVIKVHLSSGKHVSINELILPIDYTKLLTLFEYRLKDIPFETS